MTRRGVRPPRHSLLNQALTLALVVGVLFLVAWPMVFLPFGSLPYLQRYGFLERAAIFGTGFFLTALSIWVTTTPQRRAMIRRAHRADEHTGLRLACLVLLLAMAAAWLNRNSLGSLAYLVQGEPYVERLRPVTRQFDDIRVDRFAVAPVAGDEHPCAARTDHRVWFAQ